MPDSNGWSSIESAPRDGTRVLLLDTCWGENGAVYAGWPFGECSWSADCGQPVVYPPEPTHWMPLPNPPASVSPLGEGKPGAAATSEQNPSSQPSQTGEENAGLVELAREHLEWWWAGRDDEPPNNLTSDEIIRRLAAALASRFPIPGEGN